MAVAVGAVIVAGCRCRCRRRPDAPSSDGTHDRAVDAPAHRPGRSHRRGGRGRGRDVGRAHERIHQSRRARKRGCPRCPLHPGRRSPRSDRERPANPPRSGLASHGTTPTTPASLTVEQVRCFDGSAGTRLMSGVLGRCRSHLRACNESGRPGNNRERRRAHIPVGLQHFVRDADAGCWTTSTRGTNGLELFSAQPQLGRVARRRSDLRLPSRPRRTRAALGGVDGDATPPPRSGSGTPTAEGSVDRGSGRVTALASTGGTATASITDDGAAAERPRCTLGGR